MKTVGHSNYICFQNTIPFPRSRGVAVWKAASDHKSLGCLASTQYLGILAGATSLFEVHCGCIWEKQVIDAGMRTTVTLPPNWLSKTWTWFLSQASNHYRYLQLLYPRRNSYGTGALGSLSPVLSYPGETFAKLKRSHAFRFFMYCWFHPPVNEPDAYPSVRCFHSSTLPHQRADSSATAYVERFFKWSVAQTFHSQDVILVLQYKYTNSVISHVSIATTQQ